MICGEITELISNVLKPSCCRVDDLHITGQILLSIHLAKAIEGFIRNVGDVKFMIA